MQNKNEKCEDITGGSTYSGGEEKIGKQEKAEVIDSRGETD